MDTLLARCGKQKKKASSAKKQRGRRAQAEKHSGSFVRVGGVAYATKGGNACGWRLPQGGDSRALLKAAGHLFTMGDPDDDLEDDPPPGVSPTRGGAA